LEDIKKAITDFEERISVEVRRQERLEETRGQDFKRRELPEKYIAKMLYG